MKKMYEVLYKKLLLILQQRLSKVKLCWLLQGKSEQFVRPQTTDHRPLNNTSSSVVYRLSSKLLLLILIIHHSSFVITKAQTLSPNAKVSLLTVSPGTELYSIYGHSALWIKDDESKINLVYNYGVFSFNTPNFYVKFLRGQLPYQLAADSFENNTWQWQAENRLVEEQILNLSTAQKQDIFNRLNINALPENRFYAYRFFFDNCSTRLRDMVQQTGGDSLQFSEKLNTNKTYRQWIDKYTRPTMAWVDFGMDLALGVPSDSVANASGAMFLPDNLMMAFDSANVILNGKVQPLVLLKRPLVLASNELVRNDSKQPIWTLWGFLAFGLAYTFWQYKTNTKSKVFDIVFFSLIGLLGWILFGLWFGTDHGVMNQNFNLIWAFPLFFPFGFLLLKNKKIMLIYTVALFLLILTWAFIPQEFNPAFLPLVLLLGVRALFVFK